MSKKTLKLIIGIIVIVFFIITVKGFMLLSTPKQAPTPIATAPTSSTATTAIPDNLSISDEQGG